jgi:hypothetical protein
MLESELFGGADTIVVDPKDEIKFTEYDES